MRKICILFPMILLISNSISGCGYNSKEADLVIFNNIYTAENENDGLAEAFAVKDGKYIYVGSKEGAKEYIKDGTTKVIDGNNKGLIIPGCTEGHAHYFSGTGLNSLLPGADKNYEEVLDILESKFKTENIKQFFSFGWDNLSLSEKRDQGYNFAKEIESKAPGIPVILIDNEGHAALCNETAFKLAGITKENPIIKGGEVFLDSEGNLSGYLGDQALYYVLDKAISRPLSNEQYRKACEYGMNELLRLGFTNVLDAFTNMYDPTGLYEAIKQMDDENKLNMNVAGCYNIKSYDYDVYKTRINEVQEIGKKFATSHFNPRYIKLFADGVVESSTGWIFGTYKFAEEGKKHGNIVWEKPELEAVVTYANSKDITIHAHTYGDAACNATLDAFIASNQNNGAQYRNCLAHVRNILEADKIRAAQNKIPVAANLVWHTEYGPEEQYVKDYLVENMGEELYYSGYPMKSLMDKGVIVSSSTDAPAAMSIEHNILSIIEISTTGSEIGYTTQFSPNELLTVRQALQALTINGAWQLGLENERGSIRVGKFADFVILDTNFLNYEGEQLKTIHNAKILNTYFEGKNVYTAK